MRPSRQASLVWALCCDARTGSTWFSDLLAATNLLGRPAEYLLDLAAGYQREGLAADVPLDRYLDILLQRQCTPNGVFAIKGNLAPLRPFFDRFGNVPCVWLRRRHQLEQAISWYRADVGGNWTRLDGQPSGPPPPFQRDAILAYLAEIKARERGWQDWFAMRGIVPRELIYEEICRDPLASVRAVAGFLGVPAENIDQVASPLRIVRDEVTRQWLELLQGRPSAPARSDPGSGRVR